MALTIAPGKSKVGPHAHLLRSSPQLERFTMTTQTLSLTDFLLARIAEDEAEARRVADDYPSFAGDGGWYGNADDVMVSVGLGRALAECAAKRRIVEECEPWVCVPEPAPGAPGCHYDSILGHLAAVYADHADYREEWRPWRITAHLAASSLTCGSSWPSSPTSPPAPA